MMCVYSSYPIIIRGIIFHTDIVGYDYGIMKWEYDVYHN